MIESNNFPFESDSERIPRGKPREMPRPLTLGLSRALTRDKRANPNVFFFRDRSLPAASCRGAPMYYQTLRVRTRTRQTKYGKKQTESIISM